MKTALNAPIGTMYGDYLLESTKQNAWFLCWYVHILGANKSEHRTKPDPNPQGSTIMCGNYRPVHATGDEEHCDQHESSTMKVKRSFRWADFTFYSKHLRLLETVCRQKKPRWDDHLWRCDWLGYRLCFRYSCLSLISRQVARKSQNKDNAVSRKRTSA